MGVQVPFVLANWRAIYPEFNTLADATIENYVGLASTLHRNDGVGPVSNATSQTTLLYLAVAHVAALFGGVNGNPPSNAVGRVAAAGQGSVNAQLDYGPVTNSEAFWVQTKYGAMYWQMTAVYRTMRYVGRPRCGVGLWP